MNAAASTCQTAIAGLQGWPLALVIIAAIAGGAWVLVRFLS